MMAIFNQKVAVELYCAEQRRLGYAEGLAEARLENAISILLKLVQQGLLTKKQAAEQVDMTEAEFDARCSMLD